MKTFALIVILLLVALPCIAEEPVEIPGTRPMNAIQDDNDHPTQAASPVIQFIDLSTIIADGTNGTLDFRSHPEAHTIGKIRGVHCAYDPTPAPIGPSAFIVEGLEIESIPSALPDLAENRPTTISEGTPSSIVFFARPISGFYVWIESVSIGDGIINIEYTALPNTNSAFWNYLAIIPLPPLASGSWHVDTTPRPLPEGMASIPGYNEFLAATVKQCISKGFDFKVTAPPNGELVD